MSLTTTYEEFSIDGLVFLGIFVAVILVVLVFAEIDIARAKFNRVVGGQRVLPGEGPLLREMPLPSEPPLEDELFTKVEEYRNDFPDAS